MMPCMRRMLASPPCPCRPARRPPGTAPGSLSTSDDSPPIFFIWPSCCRKSFRSKRLPDLSLSARSFGRLLVDGLAAPPRPATRCRPCRGCGWPSARGGSSRGRSSFSPTPTNLIGLPVIGLDRQRRAAARVAVELGQHHAGQRQRLVEGAGGVDRVLALHRVDDEQGLDRRELRVQRRDLAPSSASSMASRPAVSTSSTSW